VPASTALHQLLDRLGVDVANREHPYGVPMTTPLPSDAEHAAYDPESMALYQHATTPLDHLRPVL
jgi:hypothetical protein